MEQLLNYELGSQGTGCQISKETESTNHNTDVLGRDLWAGRAFTCNCGDYLLIRPFSAIPNGPMHSRFVRPVSLSTLKRPRNRRKASFLCSDSFSHNTAKPRSRERRKWARRKESALGCHSLGWGGVLPAPNQHLWSCIIMTQTTHQIMYPWSQSEGRFHSKKMYIQ